MINAIRSSLTNAVFFADNHKKKGLPTYCIVFRNITRPDEIYCVYDAGQSFVAIWDLQTKKVYLSYDAEFFRDIEKKAEAR